jgi:penicillin-binding protein 1A
MRRLRRAAVAVVVLLIAGTLCAGLAYELALPSVSGAEARVAAIVRAHHGEIGTLPASSRLASAVVAVEDDRFYSNTLVNVLYGVARATISTLHNSGDAGGSTIAQQLAKQLYGGGGGLKASLEEMAVGVKLSTGYSRAKVLNMYLNAVYYGNGYWGDVEAARGYFGVAPARLSWAEAAMLAGLLQAPSGYDPLRHFTLAKQRQLHVLDRLVADHRLTSAQRTAAYSAHLPLRGA